AGEIRRRRVVFGGALACGMVGVFLVAYGTGLWARNAPVISEPRAREVVPRATPETENLPLTESSQLGLPSTDASVAVPLPSTMPAPPPTGLPGDASDPGKKRPLKPKKKGR